MKSKKPKNKLVKRLRIPQKYHEEFLHELGFDRVAGVDEVGRGAWAGPLVAGAVVLSKRKLYKIRDSKLLSSKEREILAKRIKRNCRWGIGVVSVREIDKLKLTKATQLAFKRALRKVGKCDFVLADGFKFNSPLPCRALKKGDMICASIAAASIIAKVYRDKEMIRLDKEIKGYYFSKHKGYGTKLHQKRLEKLGPSKAHRKYYRPVKNQSLKS